MIYLSGHSNAALKLAAQTRGIGLMVQPGNGYRLQIKDYPVWAADNACFAQGDKFHAPTYLTWLESLPWKDRSLFATAPDVMGDAKATLRRSLPVLSAIRETGYSAALVAQDGLEHCRIPWASFDSLFIGGLTAWKLSEAVIDLVRDARQRDKWVHMGRVNSERRLRFARQIGCQSVDGTYCKFGPDINTPKLIGWMDRLEQQGDLLS